MIQNICYSNREEKEFSMNKLDVLLAEMRKELREGVYPVGSRFPSIYVIAEKFGVNKMTANKALLLLLNEGYLERSGSLRGGMRVVESQPYPAAKIAYIGNVRHLYLNGIFAGAMETAFHENYLLLPLSPKPEALDYTFRKLERAGFRGVISNSYGILNTSLPVVYNEIGTDSREKCIHVESDNVNGGRMMADMLHEAGVHEVVYFAGYQPGIEFQDLRIKSFCAQMKKYGVDMTSRMFYRTGRSGENYLQILYDIRARFPEVRCIACDNDFSAVNLMKNIPDMNGFPDIVFTGFGNIRLIQDLTPFPTIEQNTYEIGVRSCQKLIRIIEGREPNSAPDMELVNVTLVNPLPKKEGKKKGRSLRR